MKFILILFLISFQFLISLASSNLLYSLTSFDEISGKQILNIINPNVNAYSPGINLNIQYQIISTNVVDSDTINILCSSSQSYYLYAYKVTEKKLIEISTINSNTEINLPNQQVLVINKVAYIINNSYANQVIHVTILNFLDSTSREVLVSALSYVKGTPIIAGVSLEFEQMSLAYTGNDNTMNAVAFNISVNEKTPNETVYGYFGMEKASSSQISMIFNDDKSWDNIYIVLANDDGSFTGCKITELGFRYVCKQEFNQQVYVGQPILYNPLFLSSDFQSLVFLCQNENVPTAINLNVLSINNDFSLSSYTISNIWPDFQSPINVVFAY
ncbi:hypothetical protein ACTFIY_005932 [Dictyostelium cf. discoideum]